MKDGFDGLVEHLLDGGLFLQQAIEILEKSMIRGALERNQGNQCAAAKQLGIHRNTLQRKMVTYEVGGAHKRAGARRKPMARAGHPRKVKTGTA
jgi:Fis family transcriptional regulator, factor for inversion stimulation protein